MLTCAKYYSIYPLFARQCVNATSNVTTLGKLTQGDFVWLKSVQYSTITCCQEGDNKKLQKYDLEVTAAAEEKSNNEEDDSVDEEKKKTEDDTTTVDDETADPDPSDDTEKHEDDKTTDPASPASPGKWNVV